MTEPVRIIGSFLSPFVRKVLVCLDLKGIPYQIDPLIPFFGDDRFSQLSPLRRVPVLIDDLVTLCDSSVICQYLEDRYPTPPLYPRHIVQRAAARGEQCRGLLHGGDADHHVLAVRAVERLEQLSRLGAVIDRGKLDHHRHPGLAKLAAHLGVP